MNCLGLKRLEAKQGELEALLGQHFQFLRDLRRQRDQVLSGFFGALNEARERLKRRELERRRLEEEAKRIEDEAEEVMRRATATARDLVLRADRLKDQAALVPVTREEIKRVEAEHREVRESWRTRFRELQDGRTRRKRWELEKVLRRITEKQEMIARRAALPQLTPFEISMGKIPDGRGTPEKLKPEASESRPPGSPE